MKCFLLTLPCALILLAFSPLQAQPAASLVAFTGARLIDGSGAAPVADAVLLVQGGKIVAVGPASRVPIPAEAQRVDLSGRIVMPGLINAHGHAAQNTAATLAKFARYGVTTVVSLGGENAQHVALRDAQEPAALDRARLFVAGPVQEHQGAEAAVRGITQLRGMDVDFVKARVDHGSMPEVAYSALIREAHAQNLKVAVHMYTLEDTKGLVRAGVDVLAHDLSTFIYETTPEFFRDPFFLRDADPDVVEQLTEPAAQRRMAAGAQANKAALAMAQRNLKTLHNAGVRVAMGTDSGSPARFAGYFEHLELQLMQEAGLTPMDIIVAATGDAAACMGLEGLGTLAVGNWADFIVLAADPLEDPANTRTLEAVYIAGNSIEAD